MVAAGTMQKYGERTGVVALLLGTPIRYRAAMMLGLTFVFLHQVDWLPAATSRNRESATPDWRAARSEWGDPCNMSRPCRPA